MKISDLNPEERLGLVALLKFVVRADHELSPGEAQELRRIASAMGEELWQATVAEASQRFKSVADARRVAHQIKRPAAQRLVYQLVVDAARGDSIAPEEREALRWLAKTWGLEPL